MNKIAIAGKMAAGKTVSAEYLINELGYTRLYFAEPVKRIASIITEAYQHEDYQGFLEEMSEAIHDVFNDDMTYVPKAKQAMADCYEKFKSVGVTMKPKDDNHRALLQQVGTEYMRSIKPSVWCDYLVSKTKAINTPIVVDDMRFKDEFQALKDLGFVTVRITVTPEVQHERLIRLYGHANESALLHPSETALDDTDFDYYLDGTIPLDDMLSQLKGIVYITKRGF